MIIICNSVNQQIYVKFNSLKMETSLWNELIEIGWLLNINFLKDTTCIHVILRLDSLLDGLRALTVSLDGFTI